ncbi:MAG: Uma2 family endonuclease [Aquificales bacterium]|nr:Uma2 family endonuclease [Aquificales bacterium]
MTTLTNPYPLTIDIAELWPRQGQWTETDYFSLPDSSRLVELSEGELSIMPPPSFTHQKILDNLYSVLKAFVLKHDLGVTVFAPLAVRLWPGKIREPDILFYTHAHQDRIGEQVSGPPDFAAEIISPGTRKTDRHDKFYEYAQAGIAEYWLVDPKAKTVEVFVLDNGVYTLLVKTGIEETAVSHILRGLKIPCHLIFE